MRHPVILTLALSLVLPAAALAVTRGPAMGTPASAPSAADKGGQRSDAPKSAATPASGAGSEKNAPRAK